ncbi:MAG: UDP-N-acetylmuramoyl-L-alanine--D-glutamate ligase [Candidatus Eutrophobiaceae bacterium]
MKRYDTAIVGLGETGWSAVRFLALCGERLLVVDTRDQPPFLPKLRIEYPMVEFIAGTRGFAALAEAERIMLSPGMVLNSQLSSHLPAPDDQPDGTQVISDIDLFCHHAKAPIIAVTGSNGKSTTVVLLAHIAQHAGLNTPVGGNLKPPALSLLDEDGAHFYLLELSSFQLYATHDLNALAATVLNVSEDHLDVHGDMQSYAAAKLRIYQGDGLMVVNVDDPLLKQVDTRGRQSVNYSVCAPLEQGFCVTWNQEQGYLTYSGERIIACRDLNLLGVHNMGNALAAAALAKGMGIELDAIAAGLADFSGLPHRCQKVGTYGGIHWCNDSKGTNIGACLAAIEAVADSGDLYLIAGGDGKGSDFSKLLPMVAEKVAQIILIGRDAPRIAAAVEKHVPCVYALDMKAAVACAYRQARAGDTVLLSPACSSLDEFSGYAERGQTFVDAIHSLCNVWSQA